MSAPTRFGAPHWALRSATEMLCRAWPPKVPVQPLPEGQPGRATVASLGIKQAKGFAVIGDHGGVKDPAPQALVAKSLSLFNPDFLYSVGDVVYFNGDAREYEPQFYEAYEHCNYPIVAIPGNHDGDTSDDPARKPLDTFMANFCAADAQLPVGLEEYNRDTMTQPYCDWTLAAEEVTIIGLYTNVPSGGHLEPDQVAWLTAELAAAPTDRPLIVTLHHPPFSIDAHHGGSQKMCAALDSAFEASKRCADLVLSGHVHDYQRFTRTYWGRQIPYLVVGNSGYHNLHKLAPATKGQPLTDDVVFEAGDDGHYGFMTINVSADRRILGTYYACNTSGATAFDQFTVDTEHGTVS